jgi:hypothetical protein
MSVGVCVVSVVVVVGADNGGERPIVYVCVRALSVSSNATAIFSGAGSPALGRGGGVVKGGGQGRDTCCEFLCRWVQEQQQLYAYTASGRHPTPPQPPTCLLHNLIGPTCS